MQQGENQSTDNLLASSDKCNEAEGNWNMFGTHNWECLSSLKQTKRGEISMEDSKYTGNVFSENIIVNDPRDCFKSNVRWLRV
jgi:hypothetical protein